MDPSSLSTGNRRIGAAMSAQQPTTRDIENWFTFHPVADNKQRHAYELIRSMGRSFASQIVASVPDGPEKEEAIKHLRSAVMWANAGVACNGLVSGDVREDERFHDGTG